MAATPTIITTQSPENTQKVLLRTIRYISDLSRLNMGCPSLHELHEVLLDVSLQL